MIEFLKYIVVFFLGYYTYKILFMFRLVSALKNNEFAINSSSEGIPSFYTEVLTDSILLYDANNTFVAQASTIEELISIAYTKYNLPELHIKHNDKTLYINEGKIAIL